MNKKILISSRLDFDYDEYLDFCKVNDIEPAADGSSEFYEWCNDESEFNYESDLDNIRFWKDFNETEFVITGNLGLWNGHVTLKCTNTVKGLAEAFLECVKDNSIDDFELSYIDGDGHFTVKAWHHDGCNVFELWPLSDDGVAAIDENYDEWISDAIGQPKPEWLKPINGCKGLYW